MKMRGLTRRHATLMGLSLLMAMTALPALPAIGLAAAGRAPDQQVSEDHHDVSPPLRDITPIHEPARAASAMPLRRPPEGTAGPVGPAPLDPILQSSPTTASAPATQLNFPGVGNGFPGFTVNSAPPDTNGAVGATQYVQWVNQSFAVFSKSAGAVVYGPAAGNTLWSGFGGACQTDNDGDPIAQYDKAAQRWVLTQFAVASGPPYLQCVAVSTTSDATGTYNRYSFSFTMFPDYPKLGVWPDAYYMSFNMFASGTGPFLGADACAFDRADMLTGAAAKPARCFQQGTSVASLVPSDLDGANPPAAGSPAYFINIPNATTASTLGLWKFHTDWATPANSTFTGPTTITVASFTQACNGGTCIPQPSVPSPGKSSLLDSLADRLMYRLAYRNFGDHEALVVNHSVVAGTTSGVRWYEIRSPGTVPTVYQSGTYAPSDGNWRWMGSVAMDAVGDMAVGYSKSGSAATAFPSINYTGRLSTDALGTLETETTLFAGAGSQTGSLTRWGDYSAMSIDPVDDCTFWYTNQYLPANGSFNWSTRIGNFKFPGCTRVWSASYSVGNTPTSWTPGQTQSYTVNVTNTGNQTWPSGGGSPVRLGIHFATGGGGFQAAGSTNWVTDQRFNLSSDLAPNVSATLTVSVTAPSTTADLVLEYQMVKETQFWFTQFADVGVTVH